MGTATRTHRALKVIGGIVAVTVATTLIGATAPRSVDPAADCWDLILRLAALTGDHDLTSDSVIAEVTELQTLTEEQCSTDWAVQVSELVEHWSLQHGHNPDGPEVTTSTEHR